MHAVTTLLTRRPSGGLRRTQATLLNPTFLVCAPSPPYYGCHQISAESGDVAQLGERRVRNAKVESSILFISTKHPFDTIQLSP